MQIYLSNKDGGTEKFHNRCRTNQKISYAGHFHLKKKKTVERIYCRNFLHLTMWKTNLGGQHEHAFAF